MYMHIFDYESIDHVENIFQKSVIGVRPYV